MKIVAEMDDATYFENKAIENIRHAQQVSSTMSQELLEQSVSLLLLALVKRASK